MKTAFSRFIGLAVAPLVIGLLASSVCAQVPAPKIDARTAQNMVERVLKETSAIRGLRIKRAVPSGVQSRAGIEQMVEKQLKKSVSANELAATDVFLKQLGLAPANFNLKAYYVKMLGEQIAGYYDTQTKKFYTAQSVDPLQLETVMAHELTHALQDQHFDLSRLEKWPRHDSDARVAMSALVEGDATLTMSRYMTRNPLRFLGVLGSALKPQPKAQVFESGPRILQESLTFPYLKGMVFASNLYKTGGWPQVSRAFTEMPQSSEQILHFEKYLAREAPLKVPPRDLSRQLGRGWTVLDHDVNGEMGLALIVGEYVKEQGAAERAAAGWGGDRYTVYRGPKGAALVVQDCLWDSEAQAREWREAYARRSTNRFGAPPRQRGKVQVWSAARNGVWMEQRGRRVLILEGTVGTFNPRPILAALWR